jgi:cell division protein FtsI (penicillin-binding protein 3)
VLTRRRRVLLALWLGGNAALLVRAAHVQVLDAHLWRDAAERQHLTTHEVAAPRGRILDRDGVALAVSRAVVRVSVAPGEIADVEEVRSILTGALGLSVAEARRHTDAAKRWSVVPGAFEPTVLQSLAGVRGVYVERAHQRFYPRGELAKGVLGAVIDGQGAGGIEEAYDAVLRGRPGRQVAARDHLGREIPGEGVLVQAPIAGGDVRLTLDLDLQEIAQEALSAALDSTGARGGDLLVTDPGTGEVLAMVSAGAGRLDGLSAINAPYEPGSTLKPFTVASILQHGVGRLGDSIDTGDGQWLIAGRRLTDTSPHGRLTLADALRVSSNVGIAMAAAGLEPGEQYQSLRDFGFGVQAGVPLPGEASGRLRRPESWSGQSPASLAIGYEISVTPLQMAMAYGALANDGVLMEARVVRDVRSNDGRVVERGGPREVRRVVAPDIARGVARVLVDAVEHGTGTAARMDAFEVAGKTGTSRVSTGGGYASGRYFSSFAAFFPADAPQLVVFVKLDSPRGAYYGGATAAPVSRATLEATLATRQTPLDRRALLESARRPERPAGEPFSVLPSAAAGPAPAVRFAGTNLPPVLDRTGPAAEGRTVSPPFPADGTVPVPDVAGLSLRAAARRLHAAGLRVAWDGGAQVVGSAPAGGGRALPGDTVRLLTRAGPRP